MFGKEHSTNIIIAPVVVILFFHNRLECVPVNERESAETTVAFLVLLEAELIKPPPNA